jgi:hypothetical protein
LLSGFSRLKSQNDLYYAVTQRTDPMADIFQPFRPFAHNRGRFDFVFAHLHKYQIQFVSGIITTRYVVIIPK